MLDVDSRCKALGAVILQDGKPVAFGSKTITTCEKRYANIERELLAIVWAHRNFTPTMEDKNPWNSHGKRCFHILNLSNVQM